MLGMTITTQHDTTRPCGWFDTRMHVPLDFFLLLVLELNYLLVEEIIISKHDDLRQCSVVVKAGRPY